MEIKRHCIYSYIFITLKKALYKNKSLSTLKGERWKDVPDFEGIYKVSNLGRIKSLDRVIPTRD